MVVEAIKDSAGLGIAAGAVAILPERILDLGMFPVGYILGMDYPAAQPDLAVGGLINLKVGIISLVIALAVVGTRYFLNPPIVAQFEQQGVPYGSPYETVGIRQQGAYTADFQAVAGRMPGKDPIFRTHPQAIVFIDRKGVHAPVFLPDIEAGAVEAAKAIARAHPQETVGILGYGIHAVGGQTFRTAIIHETPLHGAKAPRKQQEEYDKETPHLLQR